MIDEIQYLQSPANFLKYHYDLNRDKLKLIVTGSSAFYLDKNFDDSLAGRKRIINMLTLSFGEFLRFKNHPELEEAYTSASSVLPDLSSLPLLSLRKIFQFWDEYIIWGGYPKVVLAEGSEEKERILSDLLISYVKRDFLECGIQKPELAYQLMKLLAFQTGCEVNRNRLSIELGDTNKTIENMLYMMQKTFHLALIYPFYGGHPKELRKMPKVYFWIVACEIVWSGIT